MKRTEYLTSLIPDMDLAEAKYRDNFEKYARYMGNGVYTWKGVYAKDTAELFLIGVLYSENIPFKEK